MAEEKKEKWLNVLAVATVIYAVCATLSTFKGGSFSTRSLLSQAQASDKWAHFQSKSMKGYLYEIQKSVLELQAKQLTTKDKQVAEDYDKLINNFSEKISNYNQEKNNLQKEATQLETNRDEAQKQSKPFGVAVIFLQIAILLSSIAALLKRKYVWYLGLLVGLVGLLYFADGFFLFMKL